MHSMKSKSLEEKKNGGTEENNCEDILSSLHDDLLIHILMFLPTIDVVATMILSKRWKSIWKMVPRLEYEERKGNTNNERRSVRWFLENSFQQHKAPIVESLSIKINKECLIDDADVSKWIARAVDRQVSMLNLTLICSVEPIVLPTSLYTCETLVELILCGKILIDVPSSVRLNSLKKLSLKGVVYKEEDFVSRLLSRCPVLGQLSVQRYKNDNVTNFKVEVPSLKKLRYENHMDHDDVGNIRRPLLIDCPVLKNLIIMDNMGPCSSQNMPCLDRLSVISAFWYPDKKFLKPFSSVMSLRLTMNHAMVNCCNVVYFPRLRAINISPLCMDWMGALLHLLNNSPIVKHLEIDTMGLVELSYEGIPISWKQQNCVPKCVSSKLQVLEWFSYGRQTKDKELAAYILENSKCLKYAEFLLYGNHVDTTKMLREELDSISRVSTSNLKVHE